MKVNFNHFESFSTIDYPNRVCCVVFLNGCNFRCHKCHNIQTWTNTNYIDINAIKNKIFESKPLIHTVVFSGGEPTHQIIPLFELCKFSKEIGFNVGIETNGFYTDNIIKLKPYVDLFIIDIKAPITNQTEYYKSTKNKLACMSIKDTLGLDIPIQIRIVNFDEEKTDKIVKSLPIGMDIKIVPINKNKK